MTLRIIGAPLTGILLLCFADLARAETVAISGAVTLAPGFTVQIGARISGSPTLLTGQGFDSPFRADPLGPPTGYCRFPLAGARDGDLIIVIGEVTFSNDPTLDGIPVIITADASTGSIVFDFGPFTLTGTGSVIIAH